MVEVGFYAPSHANQNRLRPDSLHNFACNGMWMVCTSILSRVVPKRFEAQPKEVNTSCPLQAAVTSNGLALQFASQTLKDDEEVVWCAVNQEQSMGFPWISLCLDFFWWTSLIDVEICLPRVIVFVLERETSQDVLIRSHSPVSETSISWTKGPEFPELLQSSVPY